MGAFMADSPFPAPVLPDKFDVHRTVRAVLGRAADSFFEGVESVPPRRTYHAWVWRDVTRAQADAVGDRLGVSILWFSWDDRARELTVACKPPVRP